MAFQVFLPFLSGLFGWVYFFAWSLSFYPQPYLSYSRKTTSGTTIDFPFLNNIGFSAYLLSNVLFYYSPLIRAQYAARNHGQTPTVQFNDVAFALHAWILCAVITSQYLPNLWSFPSNKGNKPSRFILGVSVGCLIGVGTIFGLVALSPHRNAVGAVARENWVWIDVVYAVSYVKLMLTLIKYAPQAVENWRNRSTEGWSIYGFWCDLVGGVLSIAQLVVDCYIQGDWSGLTGNPVKLLLGNVSIAYDFVFFTQHYVLYRGAGGKEGEGEALLGGEGDVEGGPERE